nr:unnamed protein product [Callosobruchus analis]
MPLRVLGGSRTVLPIVSSAEDTSYKRPSSCQCRRALWV